MTGKRTGPRFIYDTNEPVRAVIAGAQTEIFPAKTPSYWLVNLDARYSLASLGFERTHLQLNVYNLFDQYYVGGFGGGLNQSITRNTAGVVTNFGGPPFVQIGAPRTISGTLTFSF